MAIQGGRLRGPKHSQSPVFLQPRVPCLGSGASRGAVHPSRQVVRAIAIVACARGAAPAIFPNLRQSPPHEVR